MSTGQALVSPPLGRVRGWTLRRAVKPATAEMSATLRASTGASSCRKTGNTDKTRRSPDPGSASQTLCQGMASAMPHPAFRNPGFSPCASAVPRQRDDGESHGLSARGEACPQIRPSGPGLPRALFPYCRQYRTDDDTFDLTNESARNIAHVKCHRQADRNEAGIQTAQQKGAFMERGYCSLQS